MLSQLPGWVPELANVWAIRFSGVSFSYNLAYAIFGGVTPIIVIWLLRFDQLAPAYYTGVLSLLGFAVGIFLTDRSPNQVLGVSHSPALFNAPTFGVRKD